jgi:uncharacterized protein YhaN
MNLSDIFAEAFDGIAKDETLSERLALLKYQMDTEVERLTLEIERLTSENSALHAQVQERSARIRALEGADQQIQFKELPTAQRNILIHLAKSDKSVEVAILATTFQLSKESTRFHLEELEHDGLIGCAGEMEGTPSYHVSKVGRRYLNSRGLLR